MLVGKRSCDVEEKLQVIRKSFEYPYIHEV
jgi:hypothetical protein